MGIAHKTQYQMIHCKERAALLLQGKRKPMTKKEILECRHHVQIDPEVFDQAKRLKLFKVRPRSHEVLLSLSGWVEEQMVQKIREIETKRKEKEKEKMN
jgi:hypothetical protein